MPHYVLIQFVDGQFIPSEFSEDNLIAGMQARGFEHTGPVSNGYLRKELQGQPRFRGLNGPMWGGEKNGQPIVRYETVEAYQHLSI